MNDAAVTDERRREFQKVVRTKWVRIALFLEHGARAICERHHFARYHWLQDLDILKRDGHSDWRWPVEQNTRVNVDGLLLLQTDFHLTAIFESHPFRHSVLPFKVVVSASNFRLNPTGYSTSASCVLTRHACVLARRGCVNLI